MISVLALVSFGVSACTSSGDEDGADAMASPGDASERAPGDEQSPSAGESTTTNDDQPNTDALPPESETGVGDDPAGEGSRAVVDEPDPVIESADGLSTEPVNGGAEPGKNAGVDVGPSMPASAAEICAVVEFGYIGLLDGDSGAGVQERLLEGATNAATLGDERYAATGAALVDAVGTASMSERADALLAVCAADGFERLT